MDGEPVLPAPLRRSRWGNRGRHRQLCDRTEGTTRDHVAITYVSTYGDRANAAPTDKSDHDDSAGVSECLGELLLEFGFNVRLFDSPTVGTAFLAIVLALADVLVVASADRGGTDDPENDDICNTVQPIPCRIPPTGKCARLGSCGSVIFGIRRNATEFRD